MSVCEPLTTCPIHCVLSDCPYGMCDSGNHGGGNFCYLDWFFFLFHCLFTSGDINDSGSYICTIYLDNVPWHLGELID